MNLIFAELIMAMFGIPVNFTASLLHGWKFGGMMCDIFGFLLTLGGKYISCLPTFASLQHKVDISLTQKILAKTIVSRFVICDIYVILTIILYRGNILITIITK